MEPAPIAVFAYNRLDTLISTISALQNNYLATDSVLYIFSDASKNFSSEDSVIQVRKFIKSICGFKQIHIIEEKKNKGLANSILEGVNFVFNNHDRIIVIEDDLVTSSNFLSYMNQALNFYYNIPNVLSICGFSMPITGLELNQSYFTQRSSSWGWATWKHQWENIDWNVSDYHSFKKNKLKRKHFNRMGSDMSYMLDRQMRAEINSWAIRFCFHQYKHDLYSLHPAVSKVQNVGLENIYSTHTNEKYNRFKTILDGSNATNFNFPSTVKLNPYIIKQFIKPYSFFERVKYKILNLIF